MTATEDFAELRARRARERAEQDASHISWRKATLPGSAPSDPPGYVARNGESRAYVRPLEGEYEYGRLVVDDVVPILEIRGTRRLLHDAKTAAFELVRETLDKEESMAATAEKEKTTAAAPTSTEELRVALVEAVKVAVPDATSEWNKSERYETFRIDGRSFALVFKAGARSVAVKIPAQLRDKTRVSGNHGFKKSDYGLMRSFSKKSEIATVVRVIAAAAKAAKPAATAAEPAAEGEKA